jgi:hypothetical protein
MERRTRLRKLLAEMDDDEKLEKLGVCALQRELKCLIQPPVYL